MSFIRTTAINKILKMKARKKVIPGGTSAGKTYGIIPILINKACKTPNLEISVVSESIPHLRKGAMKDFLKILKLTRRYVPDRWNQTFRTYTFSNGSYIEFFSADQEDKLRGPRRNILYLNEANNIPFETYHQLSIRTSEDIYIDFNPTHEFWVHTELLQDDDVEVLTLTYKDNEGLPATIAHDIERAREKAKTSEYWANWWKVYGLGELGNLEGTIFTNYRIIDEIPKEAKLIGSGLDFGYTNDPSAGVAGYNYNNQRIFDELFYERGWTNPDLAKKIKALELPGFNEWIADSSEPKLIDELRQHGINVYPVKRGADSIRFGIDILLQEPFLVTRQSTNLIAELRRYMWEKIKGTTEFQNRPASGQQDHAIDAMRYLAMEKWAKSREGYELFA